MTTLLVVNPYCRKGEETDLSGIEEELARLGPVDVFKLGNGKKVADRISELGDSLERIVVGGGDGTLNSILPDVLETGLPLGVLPLGTANDFARSLSLPDDPVEAAKVIAGSHTQDIDVGVVNGHYFLNAVGIGLGPELTKEMDRDTKKRLGVVAYFESLIHVFYRRRRRVARITIDGKKYRVPFVQITIGNGRHYGGGMTVCEDASIDDGLLHVLCVRPLTPMQLFLRGLRLKFGAVKDDEKLFYNAGKNVDVEVRRNCEVTADGELVSMTPIKCSTLKNSLKVFVTGDDANEQEAAEERAIEHRDMPEHRSAAAVMA